MLRRSPVKSVGRRIVRATARLGSRRQLSLAGETLLRAFATAFPEAVFIEIGANDGEQHDHLGPLIRTNRWRGVMVEPVPYVFARLCRNYGGLERVALENAAIADTDGQRPFYHLAPVADYVQEGLPQWYDGIGSFSREAVVDHVRLIPDIEQRLVETKVPCLTFDSLCAKHSVTDLDLLVVDTEGYDHEILRSTDFARYRPAMVVYEHYHLPLDQIKSTRDAMHAAGYLTMAEGFDTWCLRPEADARLARLWRGLHPAHPELTVHTEPL
jgi:FkbM family methyltransferase